MTVAEAEDQKSSQVKPHCYVVAATGDLDLAELRRQNGAVDAVVPLNLASPPTEWNALVLDNAAWHNDAYRHPYFYMSMALGAIMLLSLFWMLTPWFPWK